MSEKHQDVHHCCDKLNDLMDSNTFFYYPDESIGFAIDGCCGGCFAATEMKFCPFCGTELRVLKPTDN